MQTVRISACLSLDSCHCSLHSGCTCTGLFCRLWGNKPQFGAWARKECVCVFKLLTVWSSEVGGANEQTWFWPVIYFSSLIPGHGVFFLFSFVVLFNSPICMNSSADRPSTPFAKQNSVLTSEQTWQCKPTSSFNNVPDAAKATQKTQGKSNSSKTTKNCLRGTLSLQKFMQSSLSKWKDFSFFFFYQLLFSLAKMQLHYHSPQHIHFCFVNAAISTCAQ